MIFSRHEIKSGLFAKTVAKVKGVSRHKQTPPLLSHAAHCHISTSKEPNPKPAFMLCPSLTWSAQLRFSFLASLSAEEVGGVGGGLELGGRVMMRGWFLLSGDPNVCQVNQQ